MSMIPVDAVMWRPGEKKVYFFREGRCVRFNPQLNRVDDGFPEKIKECWQGVPFSRIDAALWRDGKGYFFSGNEYVQYDPVKKSVDPGFPKKIKPNWGGAKMFDSVDAAMLFRGKVCFFKGNEYVQVERDPQTKMFVVAVPRQPIVSNWGGEKMFDSVDAAMWYPLENKAYFFKGGDFVCFDPKTGKLDKGRQSIVEHWYGVPGPVGMYLLNYHVQMLLLEQLGGKLRDDSKGGCTFLLGDAKYFCPGDALVRKVLAATRINQRDWIAERHDCEDFAFLLKGAFIREAYGKDKGYRKAANCFGMVWGNLPGPHAINWYINKNMKLYFVEPQHDTIFEPRPTDREVYFMIA